MKAEAVSYNNVTLIIFKFRYFIIQSTNKMWLLIKITLQTGQIQLQCSS